MEYIFSSQFECRVVHINQGIWYTLNNIDIESKARFYFFLIGSQNVGKLKKEKDRKYQEVDNKSKRPLPNDELKSVT